MDANMNLLMFQTYAGKIEYMSKLAYISSKYMELWSEFIPLYETCILFLSQIRSLLQKSQV